jgi:hypothetical protein
MESFSMFPARTDSNSGNSNSSYAEQSAKTLAQYRTSHLVIISSTIATSGFLAFFAIYSLFAGNYLMAVIASCFSMFYLWWIAPNIFMSHASLIVCRESGKTNLFQLEHQGKKNACVYRTAANSQERDRRLSALDNMLGAIEPGKVR